MDLSSEGIRLECLKFVVQQERIYNFPVYQMLEAEMLYQYVTTGKLPMAGLKDANVEAGRLLRSALEQLIKECNNSNQSADGGNGDADSLQVPESFINRLLSKLRRK